jgi:hypothetical protein
MRPDAVPWVVATNLRLSPETARALQDAARASGRSQQELIREAVDQYLGVHAESAELQRLVASGIARPGTPFQDVQPSIVAPPGVSSLDLLDRDDDR